MKPTTDPIAGYRMFSVYNAGSLLPPRIGGGYRSLLAKEGATSVIVLDYISLVSVEMRLQDWRGMRPEMIEFDHHFVRNHIRTAMKKRDRVPAAARVIAFSKEEA